MVLVTTLYLGYKNKERERRVLRSEKPRWRGEEGVDWEGRGRPDEEEG